jgi:SAM-dependent methyltransferase
MLKLLYLHFAVKIYEWWQQRQVERQFYGDSVFKALDQQLLNGPNPFRVKEAFPYGETPLCSLKQIADWCGLSSQDRFVDLGCGRGRGVVFLSHFYGCEAKGIDRTSSFIQRAQKLRVLRASFSVGDLRKFDFSQATFVYFYGTTFSDEFVAELSKALKKLPPKSKIVTVSYPIEGFEVKDQFTISFPWGKGDVFLQETKE